MKISDTERLLRFSSYESQRAYYLSQLIEVRSKGTDDTDAMIIAKTIAQTHCMTKETRNGSVIVRVFDAKRQIFVDFEDVVEKLVAEAALQLRSRIRVSSLIKDVRLLFLTDTLQEKIIDHRPPPPRTVMYLNGAYNLRTGTLLDEETVLQYHFTSQRQLTFKQEMNPVHRTIIKRLFDDWSSGNKDVALILLQYLRAVNEGDNRKRVMILYGEGGNGKSTYMNIAEAIAGQQSALRVNLHQLENSFNLEGLNSQTILITGDELKSSFRLGGNALATLKSLADGQPISVNLKYKAPYVVFPNVCYIQSTNTPIKFSENNDALRDRLLYVIWSNKNYRRAKRKGDFEFDLDKLLENKLFLEDILAYVYEMTDDFDDFVVPQEIEDATNARLKSSDNVALFIEYLEEHDILEHNSMLPSPFLYLAYQAWSKRENSSGTSMAQRTFTDRIAPILLKRGFKIVKDDTDKTKYLRLRHIPDAQWNRRQCNPFVDVDLTSKSTYTSASQLSKSLVFYNEEQDLTSADYTQVKTSLQTLNMNDLHQLRILVSLIVDKEDKETMSHYGALLDELY